MQTFPSGRIRNVVLLSHSGAGKTSLVEALLYHTGAIARLGRVEDGTTTSDYEPEEAKRRGSSNTALVPVVWKETKLNLLDTPGYADFLGEVASALRVADAAVVVISAPAGVEVGTEQVWRLAAERGLPRLVVVNKMDRENADFDRALASLRSVLDKRCVPMDFPLGAQAAFRGVVDLIHPQETPPEFQEQVNKARERLVEAVAETDDDLATKYLEDGELTEEEVRQGLHRAVLAGQIFPVLATSAIQKMGLDSLLEALVGYLPSPEEASIKEAAQAQGNGSKPLEALVFKTTADSYVGKLSLFRLYRGALTSDSQVWNANKEHVEHVGQLFVPRGKAQEHVSRLEEGDIGAVAKLAVTGTGDTLCQRDAPVRLEGIHFPEPVFTMAVYPKSKADLDKMTTSLVRLVDEDPSLRMVRQADTAETLLSGLGEAHLEVALERARRKFGVELLLQLPRVPYRETITHLIRAEYKHRKQSGGHGQFGHVVLELAPGRRGSGVEFGSRVVGGAVPKEYVPAVEKGVHKSVQEGVLAGFPLVDMKVTLVDGSYHPVDSSGISFEIAGTFAVRKGVTEGGPLLLEPIYHLEVIVPDAYAGDVMGDLNGKRGKILGMTPQGDGITHIEAEVPLAETLRYSSDLRSLTQSRGAFHMKFSHYEGVPAHLVTRISEEAKRAREEAKA